jgi:type IV secretory pathway VirD2 relaxase
MRASIALPPISGICTRLYDGCPTSLALRCRVRILVDMSDEASDFRIRTGRIGDRGTRAGGRSRSFIDQVLKATAKANGAALTPAQFSNRRRRGPGAARPRKGKCSRIGRGQAAADRLKRAVEGRGPGQRLRRVVVKARIVKLKVGSKRADAHLRYLQRDGTTRDGARGTLYGSDTDTADGRDFLDRGREDRHQFRFIVAPEDGDRLQDLRGFTRDVMRQMEEDLGTKLDWVAIDHFNTGHPHSHVVIRGRCLPSGPAEGRNPGDDLGKDLIIAQDYITDGLRIRAQERVTLELGPETDLELRRKLEAEMTAERFTRLDRILVEEVPSRMLDLRPDAGQLRADLDETLFIGRLKNLERYGLATQAEPGIWSFSEKLEPTLRELGERGDIIKAINRSLADHGEERALGSYVLHGAIMPEETVVGQVIGKRLDDELGERVGLVIDGVDGRVHHVALPDAENGEAPAIGSIVQIGRTSAGPRPSDRNIVEAAGNSGVYRPSAHRAFAESGAVRIPGGDCDSYVRSHVRRLEALRRAGIVERIDADHWHIPQDFEARAIAYDVRRGAQASVRILATLDLEQQIASDGATWLDRELASRQRTPLIDAGFGQQARQAMERRKYTLLEQGHAWRAPDGSIRAPRDLVARLERQELSRVGPQMAAARGRTFQQAGAVERVSGTLIGGVNLASGRFAMIETISGDGGLGFSLVPWQSVLDQRIGQHIAGIVRDGGGIDWSFGRQRGLGL